MIEKIGVSACLVGANCKYNGSNNLNTNVIDYIRGKEVVLFCPEELGELGTPRVPCEIQKDGSVLNKDGADVTENFRIGKIRALALLQENKCTHVILKDGSPSCGYKTIYDGEFNNKKIKGLGVTATYLIEHDIKIIDLNT
ncbi:MAG TPA: DUF523 domain-containing protein [Bacillota bacterium]|nr:DUF523 domain-containing protein [Bacillota bacterium]